MASLTTIAILAGSVAVAGYTANGKTEPGTRRASAETSPVAAAAKARVGRVTEKNLKFDAPDFTPAGLTEFRFMNKGPSLHHMAILRLDDRKTIEDLPSALRHARTPPAGAPG